jgi:polyhydroxyalkanoate synthesis regulator phasin
MTNDKNLLDRLRTRGEEFFTQVSAELMQNPRFMRTMEGAMRGKEKVEDAAARAIKRMNVPTRTEFKKALRRIEALEEELAALKARPKKTATRRAKAKAGARRKKTAKKAV